MQNLALKDWTAPSAWNWGQGETRLIAICLQVKHLLDVFFPFGSKPNSGPWAQRLSYFRSPSLAKTACSIFGIEKDRGQSCCVSIKAL